MNLNKLSKIKFISKNSSFPSVNTTHILFGLCVGILIFAVAGASFLVASFPSLSSASSGSCPSPRKDPTGRQEKAMAAGPLPLGTQVSSFSLKPLPYSHTVCGLHCRGWGYGDLQIWKFPTRPPLVSLSSVLSCHFLIQLEALDSRAFDAAQGVTKGAKILWKMVWVPTAFTDSHGM